MFCSFSFHVVYLGSKERKLAEAERKAEPLAMAAIAKEWARLRALKRPDGGIGCCRIQTQR